MGKGGRVPPPLAQHPALSKKSPPCLGCCAPLPSLRPPRALRGLPWARLGHPIAKGPPEGPGQGDTPPPSPPAKPSPGWGEWGTILSLLSPALDGTGVGTV